MSTPLFLNILLAVIFFGGFLFPMRLTLLSWVCCFCLYAAISHFYPGYYPHLLAQLH